MAMPLLIPHPSMKNPKTQRPLAREEVFYVGQTIAMVVAVDRYTAEDAAALIEVEFEPLPVEMDLERALQDGAPLVHPDVPNNLAAHFIQTSGDPDAAFARAEHITRDQGSGRPFDRGADGVPRRSGALGCGLRRTDGMGRHASADLGPRRTRVDIPIGRRQGAGHRARRRRRFRTESSSVLSRRIAGADGGDAAWPSGQIYRGPPREFHWLVAGAHADPRRSSSRRSRPARSSACATVFCTIPARSFPTASRSRRWHPPRSRARIAFPIFGSSSRRSIRRPCRSRRIAGCGRPQACFAIERAMDQLAEELGHRPL